jgi:hypothetical protein
MLELSTLVVLSATPRRTSGQQYLVSPFGFHISTKSLSLTVAKSTQLQPAGHACPAAQTIPSGKQTFDAPSTGNAWQVHRASVHSTFAVQAWRDQVHVDGPVVQTGSAVMTPPSASRAALP